MTVQNAASLKPQALDVLAALRKAGPEGLSDLDAQLSGITGRLSARVFELRNAGYRIDARMVPTKRGTARYARYVLRQENAA